MSKKVVPDEIISELACESVFFRKSPTPLSEESVSPSASNVASQTDSLGAITPAIKSASIPASKADISRDSTKASKQAIRPARKSASQQEEPLSRALAKHDDLAEAIYRVVRKPGKEISYVRMTDREKSELITVLATLQQNYGYKVTETELIRIAICSLLADHAESGEDSILMRAIVALKD